ncbi:hypothetical protein B0H19DRAFT_1067062 [Mycena capillaripes]|nr:hypothetical protein B0H19DRAFT_1067062 [Mycena capillaripes]
MRAKEKRRNNPNIWIEFGSIFEGKFGAGARFPNANSKMARAHQRPNKRNVGGPTLLVVSLLHPPTHQQDSRASLAFPRLVPILNCNGIALTPSSKPPISPQFLQVPNASLPVLSSLALSLLRKTAIVYGVNSFEISRVLIGKRNLVKATILTSLGSSPLAGQTSRPGSLNIVELSNLIISKVKVRVKFDLRLCGRVAVLRITETTDAKYWGAVDTKLADVLATHPSPAKQSKWIKQRILNPDLVRYKHVELNDILVFLPCP